MAKSSPGTIAQNKKAYHDYFVEEELEAGIELVGTEVKSVRMGRVNLKDSYVSCKTGEAILVGMHISPYEQGSIFNHEPLRARRLLLHKKEINKLIGLTSQQGLTLIPLKLYFKGQRVKLALGICRGKKNYDKRAAAAERTAKRNIDRAIKESNTGY
ncbi:MAG: SsrA-binding protein SmpB [Clostridia bacterium]|nr:SsrA-binding protein SmpB [Clostridia bacterium]